MGRTNQGNQSVPENSSTTGVLPTISPPLPPPPTPSTSPPPPSSSSPLVIGKSFIKQYYHVLTTSPEDIHRFYKSRSVWSHSFEPSVAADSQTIRASSSFFKWAAKDDTTGLRIDFGRGAIDAQESIGGGILLVVTGHMTLPMRLEEDTEEQAFVHTFFLNNGAPSGKKRQFYVHNDIFRFLATEDRGSQPVIVSKTSITGKTKSFQEPEKVSCENTDMGNIARPALTPTSGYSPEDVSITEGVTPKRNNSGSSSSMSTKEEEIAASAVKPCEDVKDDKKSLQRNRSGGRRADYRETRDQDRYSQSATMSSSSSSTEKVKLDVTSDVQGNTLNKTKSEPQLSYFASKLPGKLPGSWASLVAGGSGTLANSFVPSFPKLTLSREPSEVDDNGDPILVEQDHLLIFPEPNNTKRLENKVPSYDSRTVSQRTPEATLFCKNVSDRTKEKDIISLFEPYAHQFNRAILGITLHANRGFCFVDFDHREVVDTILNELVDHSPDDGGTVPTTSTHTSDKFIIHGRILEIGRKVLVDKERSNRRYYSHRQHQRSASPYNVTSQHHRGGVHRRNHLRGGGGTHRQSLSRSDGLDVNCCKPVVN